MWLIWFLVLGYFERLFFSIDVFKFFVEVYGNEGDGEDERDGEDDDDEYE